MAGNPNLRPSGAPPEQVVAGMARKLATDVARMERLAGGPAARTFLDYRAIRDLNGEVVGLIWEIEERARPIPQKLPSGFGQWVVRAKLRLLAAFAQASESFFANPPITVRGAIGAWDILSSERAGFSKALDYFDLLLMEAGIDDKTADEFDSVRQRIERVIALLDALLGASPRRLAEF